MKKLFFPLLSLCLLTTACKDSVPSPTIEMQGLYVNDGEMDYTRQMEALPPLKVDDELEISLKLDGNGEELNTFLVKEETPGSKETAVEIDFNDLPEETLSDDKEFTDKDNGKLGFKDGVSQTQIGIRAKVQQVTEDGVKLKFYLFSKPVNTVPRFPFFYGWRLSAPDRLPPLRGKRGRLPANPHGPLPGHSTAEP